MTGTATARPAASGFIATHRMVLIALTLVVLYHAPLLLSGSYQRTYDAYVHIFLGDHYRRSWFSTWDDRWYTGFTTVSYPPGSHYAIAALSSIFGLRGAFVVLQIFALLMLTLGVYRWAQLWVDRQSAGWAAILLVVSSSIAETVHVFGQLPTTLSLGFLLNSLPFATKWVQTGSRTALGLGIVCTMATTAGHHVTTLFGSVFFLGPVLVRAIFMKLRTPLPGEPGGRLATINRRTLWPVVARRLRRIRPVMIRTLVYGSLLILALVTVVLPYWLYSVSDPITQVSIPHASRDNYLVNLNAGLIFWLIPWGTMLVALPYALARGIASEIWPLALSLGLLTFLGTGGTTPLPRLLLGGAYDILTLDRFTFWATISILPLAGMLVVSMTEGTVREWLVQNLGRSLAGVLPMLLAVAHLSFTLFSANLTHYRPFQPQTIDPGPIVAFINKDEHWRWRYLALGFGDQMAWLSANTTAATVDGNYHSARRLPELTSRPVERLEGAKYSGIPGIGSLQQFLAVPGRYNLKYVFNNDGFYAPLLHFSGWHELGPLENGIMVWERADIPPLPKADATREIPGWQRYMWGTVPAGSLIAALVLPLWAALGRPFPERGKRLLINGARRVPLAAAVRRLGRRIDARLLAAADRIPSDPDRRNDRWQPWNPMLKAMRQGAHRHISPRRRRLQAAVVTCCLVLVAAGWAYSHRPVVPDAEQVVTAYYDHLDFNRQADAHALLDPRSRPNFADYQLNLSRDGGLVASFGKVKSVTATVVSRTGDSAVLSVRLQLLTSLEDYAVQARVVVRRHQGRWWIDLPPADVSQPPHQFSTRPGVDFLSQGRQFFTAEGATADLLDRPQLSLGPVRSLLVDGRWVVVGEVTNIDVKPADVTVNAQIRDKDNRLLASWDAAQVMSHKLLPGESSPFRIEFQSLAGTGAYGTEANGGVRKADVVDPAPTASAVPGPGVTASAGVPEATPTVSATVAPDLRGPAEFDPLTITPLVLAEGQTPASVGVYAKAVVTSRGTSRGLQVLDTRTELAADGPYLVGVVRNDMTVEAAVPHLLVSYATDSGAVGWVDHAYLEHSIAPQRSTPFRIKLSEASRLSPSGVPTVGYAGPVRRATQPQLRTMLPAPAGSGFAGIAVLATAYIRGGI